MDRQLIPGRLPSYTPDWLRALAGTKISLDMFLEQITDSRRNCAWLDFSRRRSHRSNALADRTDTASMMFFRTPGILCDEVLPREALRPYLDYVSLHFEGLHDSLDVVFDGVMLDALDCYVRLITQKRLHAEDLMVVIDAPSRGLQGNARLTYMVHELVQLEVPCVILVAMEDQEFARQSLRGANVFTCLNHFDRTEGLFPDAG
jgi:hypothetical protein